VRRTHHLYLAAYLEVIGVRRTGTEAEPSTDGRRPRVFFLYDEDISEARLAFFNGQALVDAKAYANAVKDLKALVHS